MRSSRRRRHEREVDPSAVIFQVLLWAVIVALTLPTIAAASKYGWEGKVDLRGGTFVTVAEAVGILAVLVTLALFLAWRFRPLVRESSQENGVDVHRSYDDNRLRGRW